MRYGSVCSGVESATLAWMPLGWECKFVSEVEPFPCAVLQERFGATAPIHPLAPDEATSETDRKMRLSWKKQNETLKKDGAIPNEGDFTKIGTKYAGKIDLLVGGTPCQDLSVAGKRAGFDGERSSLAIDFVRLAYESQCKWFVWENVPGVFSSNNGRDFATFLSLCTGCEIAPPVTDGVQPDLFAMEELTGSEWHGECWTLNLPEHNHFRSPYPNADGVCSLSDILVTGDLPQKYYLSQAAASGILRRASARGKSLPKMLKEALEKQAANYHIREKVLNNVSKV